MRKIAAGLFTSLDGVVESPEKWTGPYFNDQVGQAFGALMASNDTLLLDQLDLLVFPVVLGSGKRLFSEPGSQVPLTLTGSEAFSSGVMHLTYEPAA
jgi:dihydrofolate reductase